jgi:hypothetical protein
MEGPGHGVQLAVLDGYAGLVASDQAMDILDVPGFHYMERAVRLEER